MGEAGEMLSTHGRYGYQPIGSRPDFRWPNGARIAVYFAVGIEDYAFGEGLTENLVPGMAHPDVLNHSWRDYGNRIGAWRILDAFAGYDLPLGILLNSAVCDSAPALVEACRSADHEFIAHGRSNSDSLAGLSEAEERHYLSSVRKRITDAVGAAPQGWASPWIAETLLTPDLLHETGCGYVLDWCMDDQPVWLKTRTGRLLSVPYSQELNDSSAIIGRQMDARDFADMIVDQVDEMRATPGEEPLVMSVILHAFISGQPFRLRALRSAIKHILSFREELWITQPGAIARHFQMLQL
jgi:allantoinase